MDFESALAELRSGSLGSMAPEALAAMVADALGGRDEETAERAALAGYYASILPEPVTVPALEALLGDPRAESRARLRGRLWWIALNRLAARSGDDPAPTAGLAASILADESDAYARARVFVFLKSWPLRSAIFPFLGPRALSSLELPDDGRELDLVKKEARLAARQAACKGRAVVLAAARAVDAWAAGILDQDDAAEAVSLAEPLLEDFPWSGVEPEALAAAALSDRAARPRLRAFLRIYGAWLWARFGAPAGQDGLADDDGETGAPLEATPTATPEIRPLPASWSRLTECLADYRPADPWCDTALLKLELMLARSPALARPAASLRSPRELRIAMLSALAAPAPVGYVGPACEQSLTEVLKTALLIVADGADSGDTLNPAELSAVRISLSSPSPYRAEAAASFLRALTLAGVGVESAVSSMAATLRSSPADSGGLSPGRDLEPGERRQNPGCNATMAFDNADAPPVDREKGFMNLDGLTGLLAMCLPASTAHRLARALAAALDAGKLGPEAEREARGALAAAASAGNRAAREWLEARGR